MKRRSLTALVIASTVLIGSIVLSPVEALAQEVTATIPAVSMEQASVDHQGNMRTLDVVGRGEVAVAYDTAVVTIGVAHTRDTAIAAYEAMAADINRLVENLKQQGVKDEDLRTGTFYLSADYDWTDKGRVLRGYTATNTLQVRTREIEKLGELIQKAVNAGANNIQGIYFTVENTDDLVNQALEAAVADAKAKAERVARLFGTQIVGVSKITVQDSTSSAPVLRLGTAIDMVESPAPIFSGTAQFSVTVSVTFEIR